MWHTERHVAGVRVRARVLSCRAGVAIQVLLHVLRYGGGTLVEHGERRLREKETRHANTPRKEHAHRILFGTCNI